MRIYDEKHKLLKVVCNQCLKETDAERGILKEDYFMVKKSWGYFSDRDGEVDSWDLCQSCYDKLIQSFKLKPSLCHKTELMDE